MVGKMKYSGRSRGARSCLLLLLATLSSACAGSSTDGASVPLDQLASKLTDALCDNIGGCCQAAAIAFDLASCKQNYNAALAGNLSAENSPHIAYDAAAAARCLAAYASGIKSCIPLESIDISACDSVFRGTQPAGASCTISDECARPAQGTAYCAVAGEVGSAGTCTVDGAAPASRGKAGDSCLDTCTTDTTCNVSTPAGGSDLGPTQVCFTQDGLYCASATSTCQPLAVLGEPCELDSCAVGTSCLDGVCASLRADGAACQQSSDCVGGACLRPDGASFADPGLCGKALLANDALCAGQLE